MAKAPIRSFTVVAVAVVAAAAAAMHPSADRDDHALPGDTAALNGAVEGRRAEHRRPLPCVETAARLQAHDAEASAVDISGCL